MTRLITSRRSKAGLPPGSLVYLGKPGGGSARITLFNYGEHGLEEAAPESVEECLAYRSRPGVTWINVDGVHDPEIIAQFGRHFAIHPLVLEDIMNTGQRPKKVKSGDFLYIVLKMIYLTQRGETQMEQVSMVLGENLLISFQEEIGNDCFNRVREYIRLNQNHTRSAGSDYLVYLLIDSIVDSYFLVLEQVGEQIERLELGVTRQPGPSILRDVHLLKRELLAIRRAIWPLREVVSTLERAESSLIRSSSAPYFRDLYDHVVEAIEVTEMFREMASSLVEVYLSSVNNRINEVMKLLAMVATIFMPLTLITGIYGMNFDVMPELRWRFGYPVVLVVLLAVAAVMLYFFRRKKWL